MQVDSIRALILLKYQLLQELLSLQWELCAILLDILEETEAC